MKTHERHTQHMHHQRIARTLISLVLATVLSLGVTTAGIKGKGLQRAYELQVPIACDFTDGRFEIGTGFPVSRDEIMTAGHVNCNTEDNSVPMEVSLDHGKTWIVIPYDNQFIHPMYDVAVLVLPTTVPHMTIKPAQFREKIEVGEETNGFGLGGVTRGYTAFTGIVSRIDDEIIFSTNAPFRGMSGSAIVGDDGKVLGMVNWGVLDGVVGGALSAGLNANMLKKLLDSFHEYRESLQ